MSFPHDRQPIHQKPLRLWPAFFITAQTAVLTAISWLAPDAEFRGVTLGPLAILWLALGGVLIVVWWLLFSRARWFERIGAVVVMAVALQVTRPLLHESMAGAGMGVLFVLYAIPSMALALLLWAVANSSAVARRRFTSMAVAILIGCGVWTLLRTGGITGDGSSDLHWRWTPTPEEQLLARGQLVAIVQPLPRAPAEPALSASTALPNAPMPAPPVAARPEPRPAAADATDKPAVVPRLDSVPMPAVWPGFRGPARDGIVRGVRIETDWSRTPPIEIWRRPIGPGWSSLAVAGDVIYTQEQRGEYEIVSAYRLETGEPVWAHSTEVRFYESNGGPGPRATPTVHAGRVYAIGATGVLNALDAATGAAVWTRNAADDANKSIPDWGIAGSPVVIDGLVIVGVAGRLAAYDADSGALRWLGPEGGAGYSSPHLAVLDGVQQVLMLRGSRTISVEPATGRVLWDHEWERGGSIVQPATIGNDVLIPAVDPVGMGGLGIRRISVSRHDDSWSVLERWTSRALKPYFNDFVLHEGYAYGFDGGILACMDLADGSRKWKGGRYGYGQLVLLPERDVMVVLAEEGDVALVRAAPDGFAEIARFPAIEGKTWNHPVIAGDILIVRNGREMAAYRLPLSGH